MEAGGAVASGRTIIVGGTGGTSAIQGYIEATGGTGGYINSVPGSHDSGVHGNSDPNGGIGGVPNGRNGSHRYDDNEQDTGFIEPPGKGWELSFAKKDGTYGQGGYARHLYNIRSVWVCRATGGSGGYDTKTITVTPGEVLTINVGEGGNGASSGLDRYQHICWGEAGKNGFVLIQYEAVKRDDYLTTKSTIDNEAKDKAAPAVLELFLNGIMGDDTKYEIGIVSEDYGTTYEHYVKASNKTYGMNVTSNILETEVITGIVGYSWSMDNNEYGQPDNVIGYDKDNNTTTTFPKDIATTYLDKGNYLHVKAIDGAGNVGTTVHLKLESVTITLTSHYREYADENGYGPNYVPLTWTNTDVNSKYYYRLFQKNENQANWMQVSTNYGKSVKVLNIYPVGGSNQLKGWMENANSEEPNGYGKGLISVDEVTLSQFNSNPNAFLKDSKGDYKYDVIMFGSWDSNGGKGYDLNTNSSNAVEQFIKAGRGVLFGHDVICAVSGAYHPQFNRLAHYVKMDPKTYEWVGSSVVKVVKKGFLTKYPYDIETRNLNIPFCHSTGELAYGDIWIRYVRPFSSFSPGPEIGPDANNNYYLTSWNNCAVIRTGHSNGAATADEQKILANTLFYLGQVTDDTYADVHTAEDLAAPEIFNITINDNKKQNRLEFDIKGIDYGTEYDHYVSGTRLLTAGTYYSNTEHTVVKTGIAKFQYTINSSATQYSGTEYEIKAINKETCTLNLDKSYLGKYLHIRAVDNAGNVGEATHIYLDGTRTITKEEKDVAEELYCIEEDVLIPSENNGTQQDATIEVDGRKETVKWPLDIQKLFELYQEDGASLRNPYTSNGLNGFVDKSNSIGRYIVSNVPGTQTGKRGNASEVYAYILSHYKDNITDYSDSQNALYEIIAEEEEKSGNTLRRNSLYYEAKEYQKFREILKTKGGFITNQVTHNIKVGYNVENAQYIIGPFELDYIRNQSIITDLNGISKKVNFSGIGITSGTTITNTNGIRIYDQNGNEIPQNQWTIEYNNKAEREKTRTETYAEYPMPLPGEEFYIIVNNSSNMTEITKMEVQYYEMSADAQYRILSGVYNTIEWNANSNANKCEGGTMCPHDREYPHTIGHTYYLDAEIASANIASQKLLEVEWATREYKTHKQSLVLTANKGGSDEDDGSIEGTIRVTMDFSGNIWNDQNENISNGIKEINEAGIKGVEVFLIDMYTNRQVRQTVTDANGNYIFEEIPVGVYYIKYTYDGQTYKTTKSFAQGTEENYKTNGNGTNYANVSIIEETAEERQNLNNRFYEIKEGEAIGINGQKTTLTYKETGINSEVITREEVSNKAYQEFQIEISTKNRDIYFPATNTVIINGIPYLIIDDNSNINLGLSEREKTDESLKLDVYQTTFSIKGVRQSFLHNGKEIRNIDSNKVVNEYVQQVNPADYKWRLTDYAGNEKYAEIKQIYGSGADCELETYVEYMIVLRNNGANDTAYITELADYYDKTLEYNPNGYRDFEKSSWIIIRNDDETESNYTGENSKEEIKWSQTSRYGDTNAYSKNFNKMYANLDKYGIQKGQYAEIHIVFRVLKDASGNVLLDSGEGKKNVAEINGYRTVDNQTGQVAGLIDLDSKPGDVNPLEELGVYADDEDKAPNYKLQLGYANGNNGGNSGNGGTEGGENNGDTGNNVKPETDVNGNPVGYGNTIEGNVWEDIKTMTIEEDNRKISNGIKEDTVEIEKEVDGYKVKETVKEELIDDVRVELVEVIKGYVNGEYKEVEVVLKETRTGQELLLTDQAQSTGAYRFSGLTGGNYKVRFIYGEKEQLEKNIKYNGQDYQALSTAKIIDTDKLANSYENTEIMLVIDNSNSMTEIKMNQAKQTANKIIQDLQNKLPGVKIGVVSFNENAKTIGKVGATRNILENGINELTRAGETAIARGIIEAKQGYGTGKNKVMVLITDGKETVEAEERVIEQIESLQALGIKLTTVLTGTSDNIFGTTKAPRYGEVYLAENVAIENLVVEEIYQEIIKQSEIETDRSLGQDVEGVEINPEAGTRRWQINEYKQMTYEKGMTLDVEGIDQLQGQERKDRIAKLAETTWMKAETKEVEFSANNVGADKIHEVNQALVKRPKAQLQLREEIASIKVMLSDGTVLIDTAKGLSKNVMGLDVPNATVSIYMDEEIMQGATIEVAYRLVIENIGEIDRLSNYFEGASDETITSTAQVIYAYINQNVVYRQEEQNEEAKWEVIELKNKNENAENLVGQDGISEESVDTIRDGIKMALRTDAFKEVRLYPVGSKELRNDEATSQTALSEISTDLILSKLISPEDDESSSLTYDCAMEITVRGNEVGRRVLGAIPGNLGENVEAIEQAKKEGTLIELEAEEAVSRKIIITKPLGENKNNNHILIAIVGFTVLAFASFTLKRKNEK